MAKTKAEKITSIEEEIRQLENRRRQLVQEQKAQERKDRTKRLCRRMGLFESLVPDTIPLTEEQFKTFLEKTVMSDHARRLLDGLTAQDAPTAPTQDAETAVQGNALPTAKTAHTAREGGAGGDADGGGLGEQLDIQGKLKSVERRLGTLKKHIEQADIYLKYKGKKPLPESEQILFTAAHDYLKGVMNGKTALPVKAWKTEYAKLTTERKTLNQRYLALKDKVREAEQIRKSVYSILRQEQREQQPRRKQDMER